MYSQSHSSTNDIPVYLYSICILPAQVCYVLCSQKSHHQYSAATSLPMISTSSLGPETRKRHSTKLSSRHHLHLSPAASHHDIVTTRTECTEISTSDFYVSGTNRRRRSHYVVSLVWWCLSVLQWPKTAGELTRNSTFCTVQQTHGSCSHLPLTATCGGDVATTVWCIHRPAEKFALFKHILVV